MGLDIFVPQTSITNHTSAVNYVESVKTCIHEEGNHNAILGSFEMHPLSSMHCSSLLTRPKSNSAKQRVIVDFSWPHGGSVNDQVSTAAYMGSKFQLKFPQ